VINQQVLKLGFLLIALSTGISHGQQIRNEEEFDYKKQFLIHELQWLKPVDSQSFILLEEIKKSRFNLTLITQVSYISIGVKSLNLITAGMFLNYL